MYLEIHQGIIAFAPLFSRQIKALSGFCYSTLVEANFVAFADKRSF